MNDETGKVTHQDECGRVRMVDIGAKSATAREAVAFGSIETGNHPLSLLCEGRLPKGDAWSASRIAGIMAAKKTCELIPLTHPIKLDSVSVILFAWRETSVGCISVARATDRTGVEMEAVTAVSVALLNLYDMIKGVSKTAAIGGIRLLSKSGGKSGYWKAPDVAVGKIEKLAVSNGKGTPKDPVDQASLVQNYGLENDAHGGEWHRQVSLLGIESINRMKEKGLKVDFGSFAENIATSGVRLFELPIGTLILAGQNAVLEVTQIGKECHAKCAVYERAGDCVMPREGIFARVLSGGAIGKDDRILAFSPVLT